VTGYFYLRWQHILSIFFFAGENAARRGCCRLAMKSPVKWADKCVHAYKSWCENFTLSYKICGQNLINHARGEHLLTLWILARTKESPYVCVCKLLATCVMMTEAFKCQHASANESKVTAVALNKKRRRAAISVCTREGEKEPAGWPLQSPHLLRK
jgi:hypothetical protein